MSAVSALRPRPPLLCLSHAKSRSRVPQVLAAAQRHDPEKLRQHARELRRDANAQSRNALLVNGASWLGASATVAMVGRFFVNRVMPMPFEFDVSRRQAVILGVGELVAGVMVQGKLLGSLQVRSRNMAEQAQRIAALADDAEQELREADWWPADRVEADTPAKDA